jgi:hypothetical protein
MQVRKAVFDMLTALGGGSAACLEGTRWLDLFAGTGSVGLEALSRGAAHCQVSQSDFYPCTFSFMESDFPCFQRSKVQRPFVLAFKTPPHSFWLSGSLSHLSLVVWCPLACGVAVASAQLVSRGCHQTMPLFNLL